MDKPEALRLADHLESRGLLEEAAELRRLHTLLEAEQALHQRVTYPQLRRLYAQRDALLAALKLARLMLIAHGEKHAKIDAAIAKVEEET